MTDLLEESGANISDCGLYRYNLWRKWGSGQICTFVMLNPSTADASVDDPTIRRCRNFAKREGCDALLVVNLFAFRATNPKDMFAAIDPVGPDNDAHIRDAVRVAHCHDWPVIAAWGANRKARARAAEVMAMIGQLKALAITKEGAPQHPLYVKGDAPLVGYGSQSRSE